MSAENRSAAARGKALEKTIARILHRHCNFGWASYYIPSEKFPGLVAELADVLTPAGHVGREELVRFMLGVERVSSVQERVEKLEREFAIYRRR